MDTYSIFGITNSDIIFISKLGLYKISVKDYKYKFIKLIIGWYYPTIFKNRISPMFDEFRHTLESQLNFQSSYSVKFFWKYVYTHF